jgi:hypothetical protein
MVGPDGVAPSVFALRVPVLQTGAIATRRRSHKIGAAFLPTNAAKGPVIFGDRRRRPLLGVTQQSQMSLLYHISGHNSLKLVQAKGFEPLLSSF